MKRNQEYIDAFGANLRELRLSKELSQEDLANDADLPPSQIGRIERGELNTSVDMVYRISQALNIHPKELFDFTPPK